MTDKKIFYLTICFFGFGLITTLQIATLSTLLQFAGFKSHMIAYFWLIAPLTGLISQPIIGLLSDNMQTRFGRRRPLFLISLLMGVLGLVCLPFAKQGYLLIVLIFLLDIGCNGNAQLARALILDLTNGKKRTKALSWSSALYGLGAMCGGALPWCITHLVHLSNQPEHCGTPLYIKAAFLLGAILYLVFSIITLGTAKEKIGTSIKNIEIPLSQKFLFLGKDLILSLKKLPPLFWRLSLILFFAWVAIFSVWNYLNIYIAQAVFHMPIELTDDLGLSRHYLTEANILTAIFFGILQLSSTLFAFAIPYLNRRFSIQRIFWWGLLIGGFSLVMTTLVTNQYQIGFFMIFYGASWSVLTICPYELFAKIIPKKQNGYYMGILNLPIVFPQIIAGLVIGGIYQHVFSYQAVKIIFLAGLFILISGLFTVRLDLNQPSNPLTRLKGTLRKIKEISL